MVVYVLERGMISIIILLRAYRKQDKPATEVLREYVPTHVDKRRELLADNFLTSLGQR